MREIKFRAKEIATGEWLMGSLNPKPDEISLTVFFANISTGRFDINTLGEYTGLKDKTGKEIYEGDIVTILSNGYPKLVEWVDNYAGFNIRANRKNHKGFEVIGNIYENKELLES